VVEKGYGDVGLVGLVVVVQQVEGEACFLVGEEEDLVEGFGIAFFVGEEGEAPGAVGWVLEVGGAADAEDEGLDYGSALVDVLRHLADVAVAFVEAVGDDEDDVAGVGVAGEVVERAVEGRGGGAAAVGHEGFDFAAQFVEVVGFEGDFELCAKVVVVEVAEDAQGDADVGLVLDAVDQPQEDLLCDFDFGVALPFVPHGVGAVEDEQEVGFLLLCGGRSLGMGCGVQPAGGEKECGYQQSAHGVGLFLGVRVCGVGGNRVG